VGLHLGRQRRARACRQAGGRARPLRQALVDSSAGNWALANEIWKYPMPWAEKDMGIVLKEADEARLSLPLCGVVKEVVKGLKIARGEGMPEAGG
jgi:3-hydroxyisobutyrate dehydrogenase/2-hydroxy-3-oxopropionate reductase